MNNALEAGGVIFKLKSLDNIKESFVKSHIPIKFGRGFESLENDLALDEFEEQRKRNFPNPLSKIIFLN